MRCTSPEFITAGSSPPLPSVILFAPKFNINIIYNLMIDYLLGRKKVSSQVLPQVSQIIAQGSFGCVHYPALSCEGDTPDIREENKTKVSKLLPDDEDAIIEIEQTKIIDTVDPQFNYHLGPSRLCTSIEYTIPNKIAVHKCEPKNMNQYLSDYVLITTEDGGVNLTTFGNEASKWKKNKTNIDKIKNFWLEAHRLLMGIELFLEKGIVHFDINTENIVYNVDKNRLNFIDFETIELRANFFTKFPEFIASGSSRTLARRRSKSLEDKMRNSSFTFGSDFFHWSLPFETKYAMKYYYDKYQKETLERTIYNLKKTREVVEAIDQKTDISKMDISLRTMIKEESERDNDIKLRDLENSMNGFIISTIGKIQPIEKYNFFIDGINDFVNNITGKKQSIEKYNFFINGIKEGFIETRSLMKPDNYEDFMKKVLDTVDSYGVGFSLMYVLNKTSFLIESTLSEDLHNLFYNMFHPNLSKRIKIDEILLQYEDILFEHGILEKHTKWFEDKFFDSPNEDNDSNVEFYDALGTPPSSPLPIVAQVPALVEIPSGSGSLQMSLVGKASGGQQTHSTTVSGNLHKTIKRAIRGHRLNSRSFYGRRVFKHIRTPSTALSEFKRKFSNRSASSPFSSRRSTMKKNNKNTRRKRR